MAQEHVGRLTYEHINCCVIVAHPDDETLWAGGTLLMHPDSGWTVVTLCRKNDTDRAAKFYQALECYGATGVMGDIDDEPEQKPLRTVMVEDAILDLLPSDRYDLVLTQVKQNNRYVRGVVEMDVEGLEDSKEKTIPFARLVAGDAKAMNFKFRYFQNFKGEIRIPEGFQPKRVRIRLKPKGKGQPPAIEETMEWQV